MQKKKLFTISGNINDRKRWGFYYSCGKAAPIVFFFHGVGEIGSTETDADRLCSQGLPALLSGWQPQDFNILFLQDDKFSPDPRWYDYILRNDEEIKPLWDKDSHHILYTGLSAGGGKVLEAIHYGLDGAFIPMSAAWPSMGTVVVSKPAYCLAIHALNDPVVPWQISNDVVNAINSKFPNSARLITTQDGHGNWIYYYNVREFKLENGQDIFQWAFSNTPPPLSGTIIPPVIVVGDDIKANAGQTQNISGDKATLDGSSSVIPQGAVYWWSKVSGEGKLFTPPYNQWDKLKIDVTGLQTGTYTFRLTVQKGLKVSTSDVVVNVNTTPTLKKLLYTIKYYSDGSTERIENLII